MNTYAIAIIASVLVTGFASSIYAQSNMTVGNMTGGNMTIIDTISDGGGDGEDDDKEGANEEGEGNN
jgi:hypothetical protein